jgi:hypothetical protein
LIRIGRYFLFEIVDCLGLLYLEGKLFFLRHQHLNYLQIGLFVKKFTPIVDFIRWPFFSDHNQIIGIVQICDRQAMTEGIKNAVIMILKVG